MQSIKEQIQTEQKARENINSITETEKNYYNCFAKLTKNTNKNH